MKDKIQTCAAKHRITSLLEQLKLLATKRQSLMILEKLRHTNLQHLNNLHNKINIKDNVLKGSRRCSAHSKVMQPA